MISWKNGIYGRVRHNLSAKQSSTFSPLADREGHGIFLTRIQHGARRDKAMVSLSSRRKKSSRSYPARYEHLCLGPYTLRLLKETHLILVDDCPIKLTPLEYRLFRILLEQPRMLVLNRDLLGPDEVIGPRVVERHIDSVRRKLRQSGVHGLSILRVVSYGYVLLPHQERDASE